MALGDYILCCKCEIKLIYDGDRGNREWWQERFGCEPEIKCPNCEREAHVDGNDTSQEHVDKAEEKRHEPVAWLYPEGLEALQRGKCWTAYGTKQDDDCNIPVYLNAAVAPKVEPAKAECGGFDSHPAAQRKWIKLTDEEVVNINDKHYNIAYRDFAADIAIARAIEDKLKSKNYD